MIFTIDGRKHVEGWVKDMPLEHARHGEGAGSWLARVFRHCKAQVYPLRHRHQPRSWLFNGGAAAVNESRSDALLEADRMLGRAPNG